jgi:CheY-like chemotaxis protein
MVAFDATLGSSGATAAVVGEDDPVTRRVAGVLNQHQYQVVFHPSPEDLLAGLAGEPRSTLPAARDGLVSAVAGQEHDPATDSPALVVLSCCKGSSSQGRSSRAWLQALRALNSRTPRTPILVTISSDRPRWVIKLAIAAGADEILSAGDSEIEELVWTRVQSALAKAEVPTAPAVTVTSGGPPGVERRRRKRRLEDRADADAAQAALPAAATAVVETWEAPATEDEVRAARQRVENALDHLPGAEERRAPLADVLGITAPALRAASGRLDARKIAAELGVSLASLARITPISRQALNETPDSARAQAALDPVARTLHVLGLVLPREAVSAWLNAPHPRLEGETPIQAILQGRAERVARMLEMARDGGVD